MESTKNYWEEEDFQEISNVERQVIPLVYRSHHNSSTSNAFKASNGRVYDFREFLSIYPNKVVRYSRNVAPDTTDYSDTLIAKGWQFDEKGKLIKPTDYIGITEDNRSHGIMSKPARNRMNIAIDWILLLAKGDEAWNYQTKSAFNFKLNFVTLTLASEQVHSDNVIKKKLLNSLLIELKRKWKVKNYIWRAEAQANGRIHFHIITDKFIPFQSLRTEWNFIQAKLGYIDEFEKKFNHRNPNGTDIHSLSKVKSVAGYLSKYCSKSSNGITILLSNAKVLLADKPLLMGSTWIFPKKKVKFYRAINGRLWGLSQQLSKLKNAKFAMTDALETSYNKLKAMLPKCTVAYKYAEVIKVKCQQLVAMGINPIRDRLAAYTRSIIYPDKQLIIPL